MLQRSSLPAGGASTSAEGATSARAEPPILPAPRRLSSESGASSSLSHSTFSDIPQVQRYLSKFSDHHFKHWFDDERHAPFSKDFVWVTSNLLGSGAFGKVYKCRHRSEAEYRYAVKELLFDVPGSPTSWADIQREVEVLRQLQDVGAEHCVRLVDFFHSDCAAWLILELLPGRSLRVLIPTLQKLQPMDHEHIVQQIAADVCEVLVQCHAGGIAHCDLKPENMFVNLRDALKMTQVLDWGLAVHFQKGSKQVILQGTPQYLAPEVVEGWLRAVRGLTTQPVDPAAADMWALGCVLLEALRGTSPFHVTWWKRMVTQQHLKNVRGLQKRWATFPSSLARVQKLLRTMDADAQQFYSGLLEPDPAKRLSADEALHHPYLLHRFGVEGATPQPHNLVHSVHGLQGERKSPPLPVASRRPSHAAYQSWVK